MRNNLPPGVSVRDIPGNRDIDRVWEQIEVQVDEMTVDEFLDKLNDRNRTDVQRAVDRLAEELTEGPDEESLYNATEDIYIMEVHVFMDSLANGMLKAVEDARLALVERMVDDAMDARYDRDRDE